MPVHYMAIVTTADAISKHPRFRGIECVPGTPYESGDAQWSGQFLKRDHNKVYIGVPEFQVRSISSDLYRGTQERHEIRTMTSDCLPQEIKDMLRQLSCNI